MKGVKGFVKRVTALSPPNTQDSETIQLSAPRFEDAAIETVRPGSSPHELQRSESTTKEMVRPGPSYEELQRSESTSTERPVSSPLKLQRSESTTIEMVRPVPGYQWLLRPHSTSIEQASLGLGRTCESGFARIGILRSTPMK